MNLYIQINPAWLDQAILRLQHKEPLSSVLKQVPLTSNITKPTINRGAKPHVRPKKTQNPEEESDSDIQIISVKRKTEEDDDEEYHTPTPSQ